MAVTESGARIRSRFVVLAVGFGNFAHVPPELESLFPRDRYDHTRDLVDFGRLRDKRVLIVGGRQSAFEWAALMREAGVSGVLSAIGTNPLVHHVRLAVGDSARRSPGRRPEVGIAG